MAKQNEEFDAIVVGSGPGGATTAVELSKRGKRVLILEQGHHNPIKEGSLANISIFDTVPVGDGLEAVRVFVTGGGTVTYLAVAGFPPLEAFASLGVDLSKELEETKRELPLTAIPDEILSTQTLTVRESALALGYPWKKSTMLVDLAKCASGYRYESKWTARSYVQEAVERGAELRPGARVLKVIVDQGRAIGVQYGQRHGRGAGEVQQAFGARIVLAAGACASPLLLRESGLKSVIGAGFYCCPSRAVMAVVPRLKGGGKDSFVGSMAADLGDGVVLGDANMPRAIHRPFMLMNKQFIRMFLHSKIIGVGIEVRDGLGGGLREDGRYHKEVTKEDFQKLDKGTQAARRIVEQAGGKYILTSRVRAMTVGGTIRIKDHLDEGLQTEIKNLYVCDGSIIPQAVQVPPTVTLVCLGKYLAKRLARAA